jgi:alkanesulfonate monooxygenase SsuD/methylene tetrahydromethanopterin reductase-like flavin-dependent oxidoreductase (luciferase family)
VIRIGEYADAHPQWDHVWVPDSLLALPFYDSGVLLAALAARTKRVRLGVACLASLGFRHPVTVARQWADLDALSGGRMTLVACPGNASGTAVEAELEVFRMDYPEKLARFEEAVRFLRAASDPAVESFAGTYTSMAPLEFLPGFVQEPMPIWVTANPSARASAATLDRVLGRVARLGDGWMTYNVTPPQLASQLDRLNDLRASDPQFAAVPASDSFPVCVYLNANVSTNSRHAREDAAARWSQQSTRSIGVEDLQRIAAIGSPEQAADAIGRLAEAGATHIAIEVLSTEPERQVEQLTELLLPLVAAGEAASGDANVG